MRAIRSMWKVPSWKRRRRRSKGQAAHGLGVERRGYVARSRGPEGEGAGTIAGVDAWVACRIGFVIDLLVEARLGEVGEVVEVLDGPGILDWTREGRLEGEGRRGSGRGRGRGPPPPDPFRVSSLSHQLPARSRISCA